VADLLPAVHPLAALASVALAGYVAALGLSSRRARPGAARARARHAALAPWVYALVIATWVGGLASVWAFRPELEITESGHFTVGSVIVALFSAAAALSRRVPTDARARTVHPIVGATALVLCGFQVFLGLQLLR